MNPIAPTLLELARTQLQRQETEAASASLAAALALEPAFLEAHNLREAHALPGNFSDMMGVDARISPDDDIFRFFAGHPTSVNPLRDYLADGWRTMVELQAVLEACGRSVRGSGAFLEFASGHGRFTRHLRKAVPEGALWVSDVVPGSVDFLKHTFGVQGFESHTDPAQLQWPRRFDVIFVLSLFSHLPSRTWNTWLQRLVAGLAPGGVLVFSTHGEKCARMAQVTLDEQGFAFFASSESTALDGEVYGCTYSAEAYVRRAIAQAVGDLRVLHLPAHFWGNQDAFAVIAP